jgi:hypothetical protein
MVKAVSNDAEFKAKYKIGAVNSINWGRIVAQVVYYFKGYFATTDDNDSDGLPGWFETLRNLSDSDATDADSDRDLDGYTAFEEYQAGTHPSDSNSKPL